MSELANWKSLANDPALGRVPELKALVSEFTTLAETLCTKSVDLLEFRDVYYIIFCLIIEQGLSLECAEQDSALLLEESITCMECAVRQLYLCKFTLDVTAVAENN